PKYIAPLLGSFNIVCLAVRNSDWVTNVFGGSEANEGMGLLSFGLDWASKSLELSLFRESYVGWAINYIILPLVYYRNVWHSKNFPFISQNCSVIENGTIYDQTLILNPDFSLNRTAFEIVGQPWQSGSIVIRHLGINLSIGEYHITVRRFLCVTSIFLRIYIQPPGKLINDPHYSKMRVTLSIIFTVPLWWYSSIAIGGMLPWQSVISLVDRYFSPSALPWWALILALLFSIIILPFYGAMNAIFAWIPNMTSLFQIIAAALIPGSSQANMYFELYSSRSLTQAAAMLSDLKLGQYTKLPPRVTFIVQIVGTVVGALLNYVIMQTIVDNERSILLSNKGTRIWSGRQIQTFNADAVLWGALGKEIYGPNGPYFIVPLGIVLGLELPVIPWLIYQKYGWKWLRYVNTAILASNIGTLAGGTNGYINTWMAIGLTSHFYIRKYRAGWFRKYNYLFGAGIDGGAQIFVFIFSFALAGAGGVTVPFPEWALNPAGNADYCKVAGS
ncbi:OPT oligopeptide transporter protein-domain-containing protein, partial [Hysterangium stoloniferum]